MERTKLGEQRIGGRRFQQGLFSLTETCCKARVNPQRFFRIWAALVITSGRKWPDVANMDASSKELAAFIRRNQKNLDRVWRTVLATHYVRRYPEERQIRWDESR
jgi:hypothetical protein